MSSTHDTGSFPCDPCLNRAGGDGRRLLVSPTDMTRHQSAQGPPIVARSDGSIANRAIGAGPFRGFWNPSMGGPGRVAVT